MSALRDRARRTIRHRGHRARDRLLNTRDLGLRRTSIAHTMPFPGFCARAAVDPLTFATFKRSDEMRAVVEGLTYDDGARYLAALLEELPAAAVLFDRFRDNDRLGAPETHDYGPYGRFSPTTVRYARVFGDLVARFGSLDGLRIIEIGGGYGGQCFVVNAGATPASYALVDLDPVLALQERYLSALGVPNVSFVPARDLDPGAEYDLVISNYAFSECVRRVQRRYLETVLRRSRCGYLICNWLSLRGRSVSLTRGELLTAVPEAVFVPERPATAARTEILLWGMRAGATSAAARARTSRQPATPRPSVDRETPAPSTAG